MSILNSDITVYSDGDVSLEEYRKIMLHEKYFSMNGMNIYYNRIGKDFGVKKEEIELSSRIEL